mgnify:CR=1 FL=1
MRIAVSIASLISDCASRPRALSRPSKVISRNVDCKASPVATAMACCISSLFITSSVVVSTTATVGQGAGAVTVPAPRIQNPIHRATAIPPATMPNMNPARISAQPRGEFIIATLTNDIGTAPTVPASVSPTVCLVRRPCTEHGAEGVRGVEQVVRGFKQIVRGADVRRG